MKNNKNILKKNKINLIGKNKIIIANYEKKINRMNQLNNISKYNRLVSYQYITVYNRSFTFHRFTRLKKIFLQKSLHFLILLIRVRFQFVSAA